MKRMLAVIALAGAILGVTTVVAVADRAYQDASVSPETGGGLITDDGQLDWQAPVGTHSSRIRLRYIPKDLFGVPRLPEGAIWVGRPFSLEIYDYDSGLLISTDRPTTLNFNYVPSDLGGRSESTLRIVRYYDRWVELPTTIDSANHVVVAQTPFSGEYGLIARDATPVPAPVPEPAPAPTPVPAAEVAPESAPVWTGPPPDQDVADISALITGRVFYDRTGNGVLDSDDFPVGSAGVLITSGDWYSFTRTNVDGYYAFRDLLEGSYTINLVVGAEWAYTTPNDAKDLAVSGQTNPIRIADFGIWYKAR